MPQELGPKERLSNNEVLRKIRIAMSYKDDDMIAVLKLADFRMSKGELRRFLESQYRNFKPAGDQVVRNLLQGMVKKYRPESTRQTSPKKSDSSSTSGTKPSSFNKGASKQKEAAGKNTNLKCRQ